MLRLATPFLVATDAPFHVGTGAPVLIVAGAPLLDVRGAPLLVVTCLGGGSGASLNSFRELALDKLHAFAQPILNDS